MTSQNFLRELHIPEHAEIDIVAVHGLNPKGAVEHAESTWTAPNGSMWLKDFLPQKLKTARVLLFGYNSNVAFQTSTSGISEHAVNLLNRLKLKRQALVTAKAATPYISIKNATYGIAFFGTPHHGGNGASLGSIAASITRYCLGNLSNSFMESLKKDNIFANELSRDFQLQLEDYYVLSFYETLSYGRFGVIVDQKSATLGLSMDRETPIGLDANHSNICKFGAINDDQYEQVEGNIMELAKKALIAVEEQTRLAKSSIPITIGLGLVSVPTLPFARNRGFTGRESILAELHKNLGPKEGYQPRAALYGLGGIGKTQIAIEFAYTGYLTKGKAVYWVSGESDANFARDYAEISKVASLPLGDAKAETACAKVKTWFETKDSGDWLLIIDNFDDIDQEFIRWLPLRNGAILFTSRDKRVTGAFGATGTEVGNLTDAEARQTLARLTVGEGTHLARSGTDGLLQLLGNLPLAIAQAAAFMEQTGSSPEEYISAFNSESDRETLLATEFRSPDMPPRSVTSTIAVTVERILRENPLAIKLLELMSLLDCLSIPKTLLKKLPWHELGTEVLFAKTIGVLLNFSLVSQPTQHEYRLHLLVGFSIRARMQPDIYSTRLTDAAELLQTNFPRGMFESVTQCSLLLPHAISIVTKAENINQHSRSISDLELEMAQHLKERGLFSAATSYADKSFRLAETLGLTDLTENQDLLGQLFMAQGKYVDALEWYGRALAGREKALGSDHPNTLDTVNNMASVFDSQGKYDDALEWYRRALAGREKALGGDHPSTLNTVNNMASVFDNQGKYDDALEWYGRALAGREKALGSDHPNTLSTVNNMASVFDSQGRYDDALEWYGRALAGYEKALGSDHPSTLNTVNNMAGVFSNQGKYDDAPEWYGRALAGNQGKYDDALEWYGRALAGREKALGSDHPSTLATVNNMAVVFSSQGKYDDALEWYGRALAGCEKALGSGHPRTLDTVNNMASVFNNQGKYDDALEWYGRALAGREKALGSDHPSTLATVNNMAVVFSSQGKYDDALEWYGRALAGCEKALGSGHPRTLDTVNNMASVFNNQGKYDDALEWYGRALAGYEKALGSDHPSTLTIVKNMGLVFSNQGKYDDALEWYGRALAGLEKALGSDHPSTLMTAKNIAITSRKQKMSHPKTSITAKNIAPTTRNKEMRTRVTWRAQIKEIKHTIREFIG
ncbi:hypothetical protein Q9L58_004769 [Maublancomyces gigas]|uniref:NB-ARC domain-containing protein n=1 Tax=Discina gigas TaxID=1032678 RepID=A0ABR3GKM7_9PEZI